MPVNPADRPLDTLRDDTVDQLVMNYGHGRLSLEAFQRRLDDAFDATEHETLAGLVEDLELQVDAAYTESKRVELQANRVVDATRKDETRKVETIIDVFGGSDRRGRWTVPAEVRSITLFGGGDIDFTEAVFTAPVTRVRLFCLFGGVNIYVNENINTTVNTFAIFGGVDNRAPACPDRNAPRIIVEGLVMFGGADVKIRRSLKERVLELANRLRERFRGKPH